MGERVQDLPDGGVLLRTLPEEGFAYYNDVYSKVKYFTIGLHGDFNVNNFFWEERTTPLVRVNKPGGLPAKVLAQVIQERG